MPTKRYRRASVRGRAKRRTRWLSVVPAARAVATDNTYNFDRVSLQRGGPTGAVAVSFGDLVGGTVIRSIFDIVMDPAIQSDDIPQTGWLYQHVGLFMSPDDSPPAGVWDPNVPSGDFMMRKFGAWYVRRLAENPAPGEYSLSLWGQASVDGASGHTIHIDTNIRRRIRENESMFLSWHTFIDNTLVTGVNLGWTGRLLIALP